MVVEENTTSEDNPDPSEEEYEKDEAIFAEFLANAGCDLLQGYFFGAPTVRPWWHYDEERQQA
jgi:hypothetical protein